MYERWAWGRAAHGGGDASRTRDAAPSRLRTGDLHRRYRASTDPAERAAIRDRLVRANESLARKFRNRGEPLDDVAQVGFVGLINAIDRFDPARGRRRLQELHRTAVRTDERMRHELGREPAVTELAARLGVEPADVLEAMEAGTAYRPMAIDAGVDARPTVAQTIGGEGADLSRVEMRDVLRRAMTRLTERERRILIMRFVDDLSQAEVGQRLGISQMHVSRLQRAAQEQLPELVAAEAGEADDG